MNLRKMLFWNTSHSAATDASVVTPALTPVPVADALSNVIQLPPRSPLDQPAGLEPAEIKTESSESASNASQPAGLMDTLELKAFFAENFFGLGRHNGSTYRTQEALVQGKQGMVSRFQNTVAALVEQRQAKIDRLRNMQLQTEGVCATTTAQLDLARSRLERDIAVLREQIAQAENGQGWVLEALNRYQIGFGKGLREAIDFELLGN
ncbi:MAG: hypothetical protein ACOYB1_14665 [Limnohabitans sp.]